MDLSSSLSKPDLLAARRVLCVQPHYDDNDIFAGGTIAARSSRSGSIRIRTLDPTRAFAPFCIFLLTSRKCPPPRATAKSEVRKGNSSISPRTRNPFRTGHALATSNGTRAITHPSPFLSGSSTAVKDFAMEKLIIPPSVLPGWSSCLENFNAANRLQKILNQRGDNRLKWCQ